MQERTHVSGGAMLSTLAKSPAKRKDVVSERIIVTPDIAAAWLDKNTHNRRVAAKHVSRIARDMRNGNWHWTGDPIRFSSDGVLLDGQHRLAACVESGVPFETTVIYNLPSSVQALIDTGKSRSAGDAMTLMGMTNANRVSSTLRALLATRDGASRASQTYSISDVLAAAERHPKLAYSVRRVGEKKLPPGLSFPVIAMIHYIGWHILDKADRAESFVKVMLEGTPDYEGDAAHLLRERVITMAREAAINRDILDSAIRHAWNAFVDRKPVKQIRWPKERVEIDGLDVSKL